MPAAGGRPGARSGARRGARWGRRALALLSVLAIAVLALPNGWVLARSAGRVSALDAPGDTATAPVALVLGTSVYPGGRPSPWLRLRLDVAAWLYEEGRVDALLVSGDNSEATYNEPEAMRDYLVSVGVPSQAIALDYAGFDTYSSCVRAAEVFGVEEALVVTQDFREPRSVALCRQTGIDAFGVGDTGARADRTAWVRSWGRERLAAVKAGWDVITGRVPVLGEQETSVDEAVAWTRAHRG